MSYNQSYGTDAHSYKMSYNPTYMQQQHVTQPTHHAYGNVPTYNFATPYNKPLVSLIRPPTFLYQVQNNPYLRQNQTPASQVVRPPPQPLRLPQPPPQPPPPPTQTYRTESRVRSPPPPAKKKEVRKPRFSSSTMNVDLPITTVERSVVDIRTRYPKLFVPMDFTKTTFHCLKVNGIPEIKGGGIGSKIICDSLLGRVIPTPEGDDAVSQVASLDRFNVKHNVRVMIGYVDQNADSVPSHFFKCYKFLVGKKDRSSLLSLGGSWVKELDGDDPNVDSVLRNTVMRTVRNYCGLDLSTCREWMKFVEIFYHRPSEVIDEEEYPEIFERTVVFFIPDASSLFPKSHEEYATAVKNRLELIMKFEGQFPGEVVPPTAKRMPKQPSLFVYTKKKKIEDGFKTIALSLDGLLDYNFDDRQEKTFEVSLFAEALKEMMQKCHTHAVERFLNKIIGQKRKRELLPHGVKKEFGDDDDDDENSIVKKEDDEGEGKDHGDGGEPKKKKRKLDRDHPAYKGFEHFDKDNLGFVYVKEFENLLLANSIRLSQGDAKTLIESCADENNSLRIAYRNLEFEESDDFLGDEEGEIMGQDAEELFKNFQV